MQETPAGLVINRQSDRLPSAIAPFPFSPSDPAATPQHNSNRDLIGWYRPTTVKEQYQCPASLLSSKRELHNRRLDLNILVLADTLLRKSTLAPITTYAENGARSAPAFLSDRPSYHAQKTNPPATSPQAANHQQPRTVDPKRLRDQARPESQRTRRQVA